MSDTFNILGISGSLRKGSYNTAVLHAAQELAGADIHIDIAEIGDIPLYNDDVKADGFPASVQRLGDQIAKAQAILIVSPEYNYSVPGVLKNAIDWVSRLPNQPFAGKAAAIMGASPGAVGTARAQYHLRQIAVFLDLKVLNRPEVMIGNAGQRFDASGKLTDEATREFVKKGVFALRDLALQLEAGKQK